MQKTLSVIDISAIRGNALYIKRRLKGKRFYAVVKADAYGHGAVEVAREIEDLADGFCVAICDEGVELRVAGITKPVLVLAPPLGTDDVARCALYNLTVTVNCVRVARMIGGLDCHIKINTGMNRYGCTPDELGQVLSCLSPVQVKGVYSHLYAPADEQVCACQLKLFRRAAAAVKQFSPDAIAHLAATAGIMKGEDYLFDGARCGIAIYGYAPEGFPNDGLTPALKVYARRAQITRPVGNGVGYNIADRQYDSLSTYRLGYADGFARNVPLGEKTLCMDAFIGRGDEDLVCVFGDAEDYAKRLGTISYEVLCSVTRRSERIYERRTAL